MCALVIRIREKARNHQLSIRDSEYVMPHPPEAVRQWNASVRESNLATSCAAPNTHQASSASSPCAFCQHRNHSAINAIKLCHVFESQKEVEDVLDVNLRKPVAVANCATLLGPSRRRA